MKNLKMWVAAVAFVFAGLGAGEVYAQHEEGTATAEVSTSIAGVAAGIEDFSTLYAAVEAAGLAETLDSGGPFTVFAPTNEAFGKLPEGTVESLVQPENKEQLSAILTYHVIEGVYDAGAVVEAVQAAGGSLELETVQGGKLTVSIEDQAVFLTDAQGNRSQVIMTDVNATNGIIHVIDGVVMPE